MKTIESVKKRAEELLLDFKSGPEYVFGNGCLDKVGHFASSLGRKAVLVAGGARSDWGKALRSKISSSLMSAGIEIAGDIVDGAKPNAPFEDAFRIADEIGKRNPDFIVAAGGGSVIDAVKAASAFMTLRDKYPDIESYFGMGKVSEMLSVHNRQLLPFFAIQFLSGSASHLTKYANITNMRTSQKMLMIDGVLVPSKALFDYSLTVSAPRDLTMDGAFDGLSHCLEVYMGSPTGARNFDVIEEICLTGIRLVVASVKKASSDPDDLDARETLGLATDLGGCAIMMGGTNGAHLNSFSLVDLMTHGRACALMNPYYLAFFSPVIEEKVRKIAKIYCDAGYIGEGVATLRGKELGTALAKGMQALSKELGFPTHLDDVPGFSDAHIARILNAAKNPSLESKLKNMPLPLSAPLVDEFMGSVLQAARTGDFGVIKNPDSLLSKT